MQRSRILRRFLDFALLVCVEAILSAQPSGLKDFGNRYEGRSVQQDALQDFTFLALHRHIDAYSRNAKLHVRFFVPTLPAAAANTVFVESVELIDSLHYFMRSKPLSPSSAGFFLFEPWPTADVIDVLGVSPNNLGVRAGYAERNHSIVYLPVDVYESTPTAKLGAYDLHFSIGADDLQSIDVQVTDQQGRKTPLPTISCPIRVDPNCTLYASGSSQSVPIDLSPMPDGRYNIHLTGHIPRTSRITSLSIDLFHHRDPAERR